MGEGDEAGSPPPGEASTRLLAGRNREVQVVRVSGRKLFNKERKQAFLEWFAATANMSWSAEVAGVSYKTVSKHVLKDPEFAAAVDAAMQMGVLRAKAKLLETPKQELTIGEDGEIDAPAPEMSAEQALLAVREHGRTLQQGRKPGRTPRIADNGEVLKAVAKRLTALAARVRRRGPSGSPDPRHHPAGGPPPRPGEDQ